MSIKNLHTNFQNSFICNSQKLEMMQLSINKWINGISQHRDITKEHKKELLIHTTWINSTDLCQEKEAKHKNTYCVIPFLRNSRKDKSNSQ